jgi:predicted RNA-binding Zn-ribbon protein involved in translation (DUF1610 family)
MAHYSFLCECGGVTNVSEEVPEMEIHCPKCGRSMAYRQYRMKWPSDEDGFSISNEVYVTHSGVK